MEGEKGGKRAMQGMKTNEEKRREWGLKRKFDIETKGGSRGEGKGGGQRGGVCVGQMLPL